MSNRTRRRSVPALVAGALGVTGVATASALAADPAAHDLAAQIADLQAKVQQLQAQQQQQAPAPATVASVLADAEQRSQAPTLLQGAGGGDASSGFAKNKFVLTSPDGLFTLSPNLQLQPRYVFNHRMDVDTGDPDGAEDVTESGFELRRAKFGFTGNMFSKELTYEFLFEASRSTGAVAMQDAWARYVFNKEKGLAARLGQFKDPLAREQLGSSKRFMAADRSLLSELLIGGDNYVQGASLIWAPPDGNMRAEVAYTDGTQSSNTNFRDNNSTNSISSARPDWGVAGRLEWQLIGDGFKGYDDFSAMNNSADLLVLGFGADLTQNGGTNQLTYTADAQWETDYGLGVFAAVLGRIQTDATDNAGDEGDRNDLGVVGQAGYMIAAKWEVFGRASVTFLDDDFIDEDAESDIFELTGGVNYFVRGHASKFTADVTYLPNGVPNDIDAIGYLASPDEGQFVVRLQYQLLI